MLIERVELSVKKILSRNPRVRKPFNTGKGLGKKFFSSRLFFKMKKTQVCLWTRRKGQRKKIKESSEPQQSHFRVYFHLSLMIATYSSPKTNTNIHTHIELLMRNYVMYYVSIHRNTSHVSTLAVNSLKTETMSYTSCFLKSQQNRCLKNTGWFMKIN